MSKKELKTKDVLIRIDRSIAEQIETLAKAQMRSVSKQAALMLKEWLIKNKKEAR